MTIHLKIFEETPFKFFKNHVLVHFSSLLHNNVNIACVDT